MANEKRGLGRGLSALLGDDVAESSSDDSGKPAKTLPIAQIRANPDQPRKVFDEAALSELASSIRSKGLLQPLLVRPLEGDRYRIIAGERRWRAAQKAGLHEVPVIVRALSDAETLEIALIENIQREDLNPLEEAGSYRNLIDQFGYTQQQLSDAVGKSRSHVANILRLLSLPAGVQLLLESGQISMGHARALIGREDAEALAQKIAQEGLTVREAEALTGTKPEDTTSPQGSKSLTPMRGKDSDTRLLEQELSETLGLAVSIADKGGRGNLTISYGTLEQLDDLCGRLSGKSVLSSG